jgi:hypothetical protein
VIKLARLAEDLQKGGSYLAHYRIYERHGKAYISFRGYAGLRSILTNPSYRMNRTEVINLGIGYDGAKRVVKQAVWITVIVSVGINSVDTFLDRKTIDQALANFATDVMKAAIATAVGALTVIGVMTIKTAALPIVVPLGVGIAVGFFAGMFLNEIDGWLGVTDRLAGAIARFRESHQLSQERAGISREQARRDVSRLLFTVPGNIDLITRLSRMGR